MKPAATDEREAPGVHRAANRPVRAPRREVIARPGATDVGVLILGMHRTGTSALAGALLAAGFYGGPPSELEPAAEPNPAGYGERRDLVQFDERLLRALGWTWDTPPPQPMNTPPAHSDLVGEGQQLLAPLTAAGRPWLFKDPRLSLLLPWWRRILLDRMVGLVMVRDPAEVAWSLSLRDGFPQSLGVALTGAYYRHIAVGLRGLPAIVIDYGVLVRDPAAILATVLEALVDRGLRGEFDVARAVESVRPDLRRATAPSRDGSQVPRPLAELGHAWAPGGVAIHDRFDVAPAPAEPWEEAILHEHRRSVEGRDWIEFGQRRIEELEAELAHTAANARRMDRKVRSLKARRSQLESDMRSQADSLVRSRDEMADVAERYRAVAMGHAPRPSVIKRLWASALERLRDIPLPGLAGLVANPLFDADWYYAHYPEVRSYRYGLAFHYRRHGVHEGRDPNPFFDTDWYLATYPDVAASGRDPLDHFLRFGRDEQRRPSPEFDTKWYLDQNPDVLLSGQNPLVHYLRVGRFTGRKRSPEREPGAPSIAPGVERFMGADIATIEQHVARWQSHESPMKLFDTRFYQDQAPDIQPGESAVAHYCRVGAERGLDPGPFFSTVDYRETNGHLLGGNRNPLAHFLSEGLQSGLLPKARFALGRHAAALSRLDRLRHDGSPCILLISHRGGGGVQKHLGDLQRHLAGRCRFLVLAPANDVRLGGGTEGLIALSTIPESDGPALLFHPTEQAAELTAVLWSVGVRRVHVHHTMGNDSYLPALLESLTLPYDITLHDYRLASPSPHLLDGDGVFAGEPEAIVPGVRAGATGEQRDLEALRARSSMLLRGAARVLAPSVDTKRRMERIFDGVAVDAVEHPTAVVARPGERVTLGSKDPLRILLLGDLFEYKGRSVVIGTSALARERGLPLEFHLLGGAHPALPADSSVTEHGRYINDQLPLIVGEVAPHVVWFPAQCPETFSFTLGEAMALGLPVLASNLGALPERLGGRSWSWVMDWQASFDAWCDALVSIRQAHIANRAPSPPPVLPRARLHYYDHEYLAPLQRAAPLP